MAAALPTWLPPIVSMPPERARSAGLHSAARQPCSSQCPRQQDRFSVPLCHDHHCQSSTGERFLGTHPGACLCPVSSTIPPSPISPCTHRRDELAIFPRL